MNKIKIYFFAHKITGAVILVIIVFGIYLFYQKVNNKTGETRYVLSQVTKGTIISSITGSGQVSALNQINISPTVSGTLTSVRVAPGEKVAEGKTLFVIDDTNAQKTIRDAEINLQNANLALQKLQLQNSSVNLNTALSQTYDNGFSMVSNTFLDLPGIMSGLNDIFFKSSISNNGQSNVDWYEAQVLTDDIDNVKPYKQSFIDSYNTALKTYNDSLANYQSVSRTSNSATIEKLITQTYNTVKEISDTIKNANNYIDFISSSIQKNNTRTVPAIFTANKSTLNNYTSQTNTHLQDLLSIETSIQSNKDSFTSSDLNTQSAQITIKQAQNSLLDAQQNLSNYYIKAPFSGVIASVPVQKGQNVGSGTTLGTIITSKELAVVSLNEVDVAKISLGDKVTLTFDAISDLTITGKVVEIDSVGTVSQGVVNYNLQISFDTNNNDGIKPGMSVNAAIITNIKQDILTVPNSAVKNQNGTSYVMMFDAPLPTPIAGVQGSPSVLPPRQQEVVIGVSNDTSTEIVSGLSEGDEVVTKTITSTTKTTTTTPSILGTGGNRGGGGALRIGG